MAGPKAKDAQGGRGAEHGLRQLARLWCSTTERQVFEASHRAGSEPLVEHVADLAIPAEEVDEYAFEGARVRGDDLGDYGEALDFLIGEVVVDGEVEGNGAPEVAPPL